MAKHESQRHQNKIQNDLIEKNVDSCWSFMQRFSFLIGDVYKLRKEYEVLIKARLCLPKEINRFGKKKQ